MQKILALLLLAVGLAVNTPAQNFAVLPALQSWTLDWDDMSPAAQLVSFELFSGTNSLAVLTTNDFKLLGVTNGVSTFSAPVAGLPAGNSVLTLVAIDAAGQRSPPSLPLTVNALPKPAAPQNLRKP